MRLSGRNLLILAVVVVAILFSLVLFTARDSPESVAMTFMSALAKGDDKTLTSLTSRGAGTKATIAKEWEFATKVAAPHYLFIWRITNAVITGPNDASIDLAVVRNASSAGAYEENYTLPMVKENGEWRIDVRGINSEMYPGLPR
jgi:hypothetical protein